MTNLTYATLISLNGEFFTLATPDGTAQFHIPWSRVLMFSVVGDDHNVCLSDGTTAFRLDVDDWNRLFATMPLALENASAVVPYTKCCK